MIREADKTSRLADTKLKIQENLWCSSGSSLKAWSPGEPVMEVPVQKLGGFRPQKSQCFSPSSNARKD